MVPQGRPDRPATHEIAALLRPALGEVTICAVHPVSGGLMNTNLRVTLSGPPGAVLLRLYQRGTPETRRDIALREAALDHLVHAHVPTARFLHVAPDNPVNGAPYAVLQWIDGTRLDQAELESDAAIGSLAGGTLAAIHAFRFPRAGFFTPTLDVAHPIDLDAAALLRFMQQCLIDNGGSTQLGAELTDRLFAFVRRHGHCLDAWLGDPRLTHADFNGSNILLSPDLSRVAAVLDWEFALSATPAFDFGNLLRPPLGNRPAFVRALEHGYRDQGGHLPHDWQRIAHIADLFSWTDLLGQRAADPALAADARAIIAAIINE